ncbi:MAG: hypothetical protein PUP93_26520 [Rhizonema sp. NSF051]|nr:hypothetical protein [Rhizonema sp. NSF051]
MRVSAVVLGLAIAHGSDRCMRPSKTEMLSPKATISFPTNRGRVGSRGSTVELPLDPTQFLSGS